MRQRPIYHRNLNKLKSYSRFVQLRILAAGSRDDKHPSSRIRVAFIVRKRGRSPASITKLAGYIYAGPWRLLLMICEFDSEGYRQLQRPRPCAHWLNFNYDIGTNPAREKVRVAHSLTDLPNISGAFERDELRNSRERAMTRISTQARYMPRLIAGHPVSTL